MKNVFNGMIEVYFLSFYRLPFWFPYFFEHMSPNLYPGQVFIEFLLVLFQYACPLALDTSRKSNSSDFLLALHIAFFNGEINDQWPFRFLANILIKLFSSMCTFTNQFRCLIFANCLTIWYACEYSCAKSCLRLDCFRQN